VRKEELSILKNLEKKGKKRGDWFLLEDSRPPPPFLNEI